jgi:hypothetical protein
MRTHTHYTESALRMQAFQTRPPRVRFVERPRNRIARTRRIHELLVVLVERAQERRQWRYVIRLKTDIR